MRLENNPSPPRNAVFYLGKICTVVICFYVLKVAKVFEVMIRSRNTFQTALWASYVSYLVFALLWFYISCFVRPRHPNWTETHKNLLHTAAAALCAGGFFWTVALWPVFHIWTIPLGLVSLVLFLNVMALIPSWSIKIKS
uniref:Transmembrane protein n=1 Tax=Trypanosoma congolense (strain IL3000) TaxID=1068625 RepID=G0UWX9_TRYCI|nr:conserved hypothetical protein [Trypanosoma congolense IL3000]